MQDIFATQKLGDFPHCRGHLQTDARLLGLCIRCSLQAARGELAPPAVRDEESRVWGCSSFVASEPRLMEGRTA